MTTAFVLINAELGTEESLVANLKKIQNVDEVYIVYGVYDIVVKIVSDSLDNVKQTITSQIRRSDQVRSTLTMIVVED
ncbi:MAG: Lrp/AsnC family transcriptional regulator [Thaumarchaeota archaeon]|nr:Lrp/AsnC family transcriptional regulator [Nitrososphaerota archaeon]MCZ6615944.1 Lrp/AsnC family transcriptional regulator [Nitrososphaerota archaeon]MCZ6724987.1 Lrp/AsnC family transcriptional regulator [Nitrososphaerota archaeon]